MAGSINFKEKYAPDFHRVAIVHRALGRMATTQELTSLGLVALEEGRPPRVLHHHAQPAADRSGRIISAASMGRRAITTTPAST
ncbi:MAG TPA: hypothetical protein VJN94_08730 [Candidatus Binataceae bacterium]|nr:hypothetical protein [Candidatus Binataceae bacterium]